MRSARASVGGGAEVRAASCRQVAASSLPLRRDLVEPLQREPRPSSWSPAPIGSRPSAAAAPSDAGPDGRRHRVHRRRRRRVGRDRGDDVSSNSANTWNGRLGRAVGLGAPGRRRWRPAAMPAPVIADRARGAYRRRRPRGTSRRTSASQGDRLDLLSLPNATGDRARPDLELASPEKSGPQTLTGAPRVTLKLIVPKPGVDVDAGGDPRVRVDARTRTGRSRRCRRRRRRPCAQAQPKSALTSTSTPAISASEVSAK